MPTNGPQVAAAASGLNWSYVADTNAIDGRAALYDLSAQDWIKLKNRGHTTSGTITGVALSLTGGDPCVADRAIEVGLSKDGGASVHGATKTLTLALNVDSTQTLGDAASDLWGGTWSSAEINSDDFCVMIRRNNPAGTGQIRIDCVTSTVGHT